ncbi:proteophosphoglycan 5 [Gigaspora margarita]|uniref:GDP-fucose protein O-fucosyltransferase 2 n=1 Tax=Gigaspora margarita TaxID=4874 RepID=A0A8H3XG91_GIGMA|nr:proteophosphoglycan 5 [Gigaspora margarita]
MFTYNVGEQETQSNRHFISFIQIAQLLGRTMVLTNVGRSGISVLKDFSFGFYYDVDELRKKFPKVKFISQYEFQKWAEERYNKPDIIHVILRNSKTNPNYTIHDDTPYFDRLLGEYKMDKFDLKLNNSAIFKRINIGITASSPTKGQKQQKIDDLKIFLEAELQSNAEVMLITQEAIYGPLFERLMPMSYASHITNAASNISKKLKPYIGIHWRMERGQIDLMPKCAESLVTYIKSLSLNTGIKTIYLATDYPLNGANKTQSYTFNYIGEKHHTAMKILTSSFDVNTWISTHALDYLQMYPIGSEQLQEEMSGGGIQGIFDKLILRNADYFIAGPEECCRYRSTYTYNVMEARQELFENNGTIQNIIDRWEL